VLIALVASLALTCEPLDGARSMNIARGPDSVTEFFADGDYRVTECDARGEPARATTMARIVTPTRSEPYVPVAIETGDTQVFLLYGDPDEPRWAAAWREHGDDARRASVAPDAQPPGVTARAVDDSCRNGAYQAVNRLTDPRYRYLGRGLSAVRRRAVIRGHHAWDETRNSCGYKDQSNVASSFAGATSRSVHSQADGRNVVDFGRLADLCGSGATLACTWTFNRPITETDQRYNSAFRWSTTGRAGTYDIESAAAHETGHSIGLGHTSASPFLTMYPQICAGCTRARTLARGDVRGLRAIY
jgi:hypothetical protein